VRTIEPIGAHGTPYTGWITSIEPDSNAIIEGGMLGSKHQPTKLPRRIYCMFSRLHSLKS